MSKPDERATVAAAAALRLAPLLLALASPYAAPLAANPCQDKQWIDTPVVARSSLPTGDGRDGIGGTGRGKDEDGIGGTGRKPPEAGSELGFIGVIAGFASICVNGQEIHYGPATAIQIDGKAGKAAQLDLGQMVTVAAGTQQGERHASRIDVYNTLNGPLQAIDLANGKLRILGQTLYAAGNAANLADFAVGDRLTANGSRQPNGEIVLTRLESRGSTPDRDAVSLVGPVTQINGTTFRIFDLTIQANTVSTPTPRLGQEVFVRGKLVAETLEADTVTVDPQLNFGSAVRRLELQGHIRRIDGADRLNIGGTEIRLDATTKYDAPHLKTLSEGDRIKVSATIEASGRIVAERIHIERPAGRADRLPLPDASERNAARRNNDRDGLDNGAAPAHPDLPLRPDRSARGAEADRPRPDMLRPETMRPSRIERSSPR